MFVIVQFRKNIGRLSADASRSSSTMISIICRSTENTGQQSSDEDVTPNHNNNSRTDSTSYNIFRKFTRHGPRGCTHAASRLGEEYLEKRLTRNKEVSIFFKKKFEQDVNKCSIMLSGRSRNTVGTWDIRVFFRGLRRIRSSTS